MAKGQKYNYLLKNVGLMTLSSFATRLLSFFLVPLYTNVLSSEEYGVYDTFCNTITLLSIILTVCIGDAVVRFTLSKENEPAAVLSVGMKYLILSNLVVVIMLVINHFFLFSIIIDNYMVFFLLMFFSQTLQSIIPSFAMGTENITKLSVSSVVSSAITIGLNILFLLVFRWGIVGFFLANTIGPLFQSAYLFMSLRGYEKLCIKIKTSDLEKNMTRYGRPLVLTNIAWWINAVSDRYVIILYCGMDINGVYSVASKIPSILNIVQEIFSRAWSVSAVKEIGSEDNSSFFSNVYRIYNVILVIGCSLLIVTDKLISRFLFANEFYEAWQYVPWLTIAVVFLALSSFLGGVFTAAKDTTIYAKTTIAGAIVNLVLNFILVPWIGAIGAAYATTVSYFVIWCIRCNKAQQYVKIDIHYLKDVFTYLILVIQSVVLSFVDGIWLYVFEVGMLMAILGILHKDINYVLKNGIKMVVNKKNKG